MDEDNRILDYNELIKQNKNLEKYYNHETNTFNYKSNEAVIELNKTLFKHRLGINLKISEDQLCPRYFNRFDYIQFIYNLLKFSTEFLNININNNRDGLSSIIGLDIGTGHTAIYPLLGFKQFNSLGINGNNIKFIGTDINDNSIELAIENVKLNNLVDFIDIKKVEKNSSLNSYSCLIETLNKFENTKYTSFTMCNPPFYSSYSEIKEKQNFKQRYIETVTANYDELITEGGEIEFVKKLVEDSLGNDKIIWFTTLIGSFQTIIEINQIFGKKIDFGVYEFKSGVTLNATTRWVLFWTFTKLKPPNHLFNNTKIIKNRTKVTINKKGDINELRERIEELEYSYLSSNENELLVGFNSNVWSRSYRRRFKNKRFKSGVTNQTEQIWIQIRLQTETTLLIWKYGLNYTLFDSFCTFLSKSLY